MIDMYSFSKTKFSSEELECEKIFLNTCYHNEEGKFVVSLPFKISPNQLEDSRTQALKSGS